MLRLTIQREKTIIKAPGTGRLMRADWMLYGGYLLVIVLLIPWAQYAGGAPWSWIQEKTSHVLGAKFEQGAYPEPYRFVVGSDRPYHEQVVLELIYNLALIVFWMGMIFIPLIIGWAAWTRVVTLFFE